MDVDLLRQTRAYLLCELAQLRQNRTVTLTAPGAGNEWSTTVPGGVTWQLQSVQYVYTTSPVASNRSPGIRCTDGNAELARLAASTVHVASTAKRYSWIAGLGAEFTPTTVYALPLPTPGYAVPAGGVVASTTINIDVNDAYTSIVLVVREWSEWGIAMFSEYAEELLDEQPVYP